MNSNEAQTEHQPKLKVALIKEKRACWRHLPGSHASVSYTAVDIPGELAGSLSSETAAMVSHQLRAKEPKPMKVQGHLPEHRLLGVQVPLALSAPASGSWGLRTRTECCC